MSQTKNIHHFILQTTIVKHTDVKSSLFYQFCFCFSTKPSHLRGRWKWRCATLLLSINGPGRHFACGAKTELNTDQITQTGRPCCGQFPRGTLFFLPLTGNKYLLMDQMFLTGQDVHMNGSFQLRSTIIWLIY